jgi:hypothetical protein
MSHADTRKLLMEVEQLTVGRLRIAVNIRMGDFVERGGVTVDGIPTVTGEITEGERNVRLPLDWYTRICSLIREACNCEFILVSDGTRQELQPFLDEISPVNILGVPFQDLVGALLMSRADLTICSNSTYSRFSVFLNDKPYIWCANTLIKDPSGRYGYLWSDGGNPVPASDSSEHDTIRRCFALGINFSVLPKGLKRYLDSNGELGIEAPADLLYRDPVRIL